MKKLIAGILAVIMLTMSVVGLAAPKGTMLKASFIDLSATDSVGAIPADGIKASNIIIFAFADVETSNINESFKKLMVKIIGQEAPGTINLLSIGGQNTHKFIAGSKTVIHNIKSQIDQYNQTLGKNKITGIDLDIEGPNFNPVQIKELAKGFKELGLIVSIAPQVWTTGGVDIDINNPHNLAFTASALNPVTNTYKEAIESGAVDYIMYQAYNADGFKVGGYGENQVEFIKALAEAVTNCKYIPKHTKVLIGEVANQGAGGDCTVFTPDKKKGKYDQIAILNHMKEIIPSILNDRVTGFMVWSLNNDYMPKAYGDEYAKKGAFSSVIFGAPQPANVYFVMQVTNTGKYKNASITFVVDGAYYPFGNAEGKTIPAGYNQVWGTEASAQEQPTIAHSPTLDNLFAGGKSSITARVIANSYDKWDTSIDKPDKQAVGMDYTFEKGCSYNIMINPDTMAVEIKKVQSPSK